ncbi:hypothetical protein [Streptomyces scopuliridis]|uniref:hypothetical protein n=1 Tax=Streptomyces scopuliridis TaxID=452529 RepID=UPI00369C33FC
MSRAEATITGPATSTESQRGTLQRPPTWGELRHQTRALAAAHPEICRRAAGMLLQHITAHAAASTASVMRTRDLVESGFAEWCAAAQTALRPEGYALSAMIGYQLDTILGATSLLSAGRD